MVVTTGTYEVLEYPNKDKKSTGIFLAKEESSVPAAKFYWKVVHHPETKTAAAFIGLNDPHAKKSS